MIVVGSMLIVPYAFVGLVRSPTDHHLEYDVVVEALHANEAPPLFRRAFAVDMRSARNWVRSDEGVDASYVAHRAQIAEELARRMVNQALPDLITTLASLP